MLNFYKYCNKAGLDKSRQYEKHLDEYNPFLYNKKVKQIEHIIKKVPEYAFLYARNVKRGRWLEAESYIVVDPYYAYAYASEIMHGRWLEAETKIMQSPTLAYNYAKYVLNHRWYEAEDFIRVDTYWWKRYRMTFQFIG